MCPRYTAVNIEVNNYLPWQALGKTTMTSQVGTLSRLFPEEVKGAVKGFDDKIRQAILAVLMIKGGLSFMELANELGISKALLSHHLDLLLDSALIRNYSPLELRGRFDSYYAISSLGEAFLDSLVQSLALGFRKIPSSNPLVNDSAALKPIRTIPPQQAGLPLLTLLPVPHAQSTSSTGQS